MMKEQSSAERRKMSQRRLTAAQTWLTRAACGLFGLSLLTGSTADGATPVSPEDVYVPTPTATRTASPTASPTSASPESTGPTYTKVNSTCREGEALSMTWEALHIQDAAIEAVGLNEDNNNSLGSPVDPKNIGVYDGNGSYWPQVGAREGMVLTGGHRYYEKGVSVFALNFAEQLATVAVDSVIVFTMKDGGTCSYKVKETYPQLDKFDQENGYPAFVRNKGWYRKDGSPAELLVVGCTGKWNAKKQTSQGSGVAKAELMNDQS